MRCGAVQVEDGVEVMASRGEETRPRRSERPLAFLRNDLRENGRVVVEEVGWPPGSGVLPVLLWETGIGLRSSRRLFPHAALRATGAGDDSRLNAKFRPLFAIEMAVSWYSSPVVGSESNSDWSLEEELCDSSSTLSCSLQGSYLFFALGVSSSGIDTPAPAAYSLVRSTHRLFGEGK